MNNRKPKKRTTALVALACFSFFSLFGCKPDLIEFTIYTSDVEEVKKGEIVEVPVTITFSLLGKDREALLEKATQISKKYIHKESKFSISEGDYSQYLVVETKIPFASRDGLKKYVSQNNSVAVIDWDTKNWATLAANQGTMKKLDKELENLDFSLGMELPAKRTRIRVVNDLRKPTEVFSQSVWVLKTPHLVFEQTLKRREEVIIEFKGGDESVYSVYSPAVSIE